MPKSANTETLKKTERYIMKQTKNYS